MAEIDANIGQSEIIPKPIIEDLVEEHCTLINQYQDGRIFSFKYTFWRVLYRVGMTCIVVLLGCGLIFRQTKGHESLFRVLLSQTWGWFFLLMGIIVLLDLILTKEIILYPQKITKIWRFGLRRDVILASSSFGTLRTFFNNGKWFCPSWHDRHLTLIHGLHYDEYLTEVEIARTMNIHLAEVSGRDLSTFEPKCWESVAFKSFLKQEITHE
jgi:hypothetical protein